MKILNGSELAGYIKGRQLRAVSALTQSYGIIPKLAIIQVKDDPVINTYVRLKNRYGSEIGVEVETFKPKQSDIKQVIDDLNADESVHGIIVQLPLEDTAQTDEIVNMVTHSKDVDALADKSDFDPATPTAILWLLAGYNIELKGKDILIVGKGKLVGSPLNKMLKASGLNVKVADRSVTNLSELTLDADVIVTATGSPAILYSSMIKPGAVVVDAGVASEEGKTVGDLANDIYERDDLTLTPRKGGVGPLTVCSLFENVIKAASQTTQK
jgi:methylenetetrahydrofolate dehydrogenase (NADP+)/methenyltetrahydrofolate cyclohydrolase